MKKFIFLLLTVKLFSIGALDYFSIPDDQLVEMAEAGDSEAIYHLGLLIEDLEYKEDFLRLDYVNRDIFYWFEKAAELNHPGALTRTGREYLSNYGYYNSKNYDKAVEILTKASDGGSSEASLLLSVIYFHGLNGTVNKTKAVEYLKKSQEKLFRIRPMLFLEKELVEMIRTLEKEDNPDAAFVLGDFYYYGRTGYYEQSYEKAYALYSQGAELGSSSSAYLKGMMLYNGVGVLKDINNSYIWIKKSAEAGKKEGIIKAGVMSYFGEGTERDLDEAFKLFSITAEMDDSLSQYFIGVMYYKGEATQRSLTISKEWIKRAYENGSLSAKKFWENQSLWQIDIVEDEPVETAEDEPVGTAEDEPVGTAEDKPVDTAEDEPVGTAEDKTVDTTEDKPAETAEEKPVDTSEVSTVGKSGSTTDDTP